MLGVASVCFQCASISNIVPILLQFLFLFCFKILWWSLDRYSLLFNWTRFHKKVYWKPTL